MTRRKKAHTSKKWRVRVRVHHSSGIFKRPSIQYYTLTSKRPITGWTAIERFKKQHRDGSRISFTARSPRQKHASRVVGAYGFVDYSHGISARAIIER